MDERTQTVEELHRRYAGVLYHHCVRILGDPAEAEDAVQETFVNVFRSYASFRYGDSHLPWLYRIGTNVCLKMIRTKRRKGTELTERPEAVAAPSGSQTGRLHARRVLERLVDELDDRGLEILVAHYFGGMDQGQIARSLGISRRAVVKRLTALRAKAGHLFEEGV